MQRIKLVFTRSKDDVTQQYIVYRAVSEGTPMPAYVIEHPQEANLIRIEDDVLFNDGGIYYTTYGNIFEESINIKVDGQHVTPVAIDYAAGSIILDPVPDPAAIVTADYYFDGITVIDTSTPQPGVTPLSEPAVDRTPPQPATNPRLNRDLQSGLVRLEYDMPPAASGTTYEYYVVSADRFGNRSWPSPIAQSTLFQNMDTIPFIIERSTDEGATWETVGETSELVFFDTPFFIGPMSPVEELSGEVQAIDETIQVVLSWQPPQATYGQTMMYRVRTRSALGAISDPSAEVGPEEFERVAVRYAVYRKTGEDMELLGHTTELTFTDPDVELDTTYTYAVAAVDALDNESEPVEIEIATEIS